MKQVLLVPELRELPAANETETIRRFCTETHPATVAELISGLDAAEVWQVLHLLGVKDRAEVFSHFELDQQVELATGENRREMAKLLEEMDPDERADLVQRLDEKVRDELLPLVAKAEREDIRKLVSYAEGTAGAVMTTDYAALKPGIGITQALEQIRIQAPGKATIYSMYVVDDQHRLVGFVSLKDLILAKPSQTVGEIMHHDVIAVAVGDDQEEVAPRIEKYDLLAIPVINGNNVLVGIVTHDDAMDILGGNGVRNVCWGVSSVRQEGGLRRPGWRPGASALCRVQPRAFHPHPAGGVGHAQQRPAAARPPRRPAERSSDRRAPKRRTGIATGHDGPRCLPRPPVRAAWPPKPTRRRRIGHISG
jgi:Mg2+ transporter MgtE